VQQCKVDGWAGGEVVGILLDPGGGRDKVYDGGQGGVDTFLAPCQPWFKWKMASNGAK